jgi:hypothetical protein
MQMGDSMNVRNKWVQQIVDLQHEDGSWGRSEKLGFAVDWLKSQQDENGLWDMRSVVKDGIHFPLSDSWRKIEDRKRDCTTRVIRLIEKLEVTI